jgi:hypothetical protein
VQLGNVATRVTKHPGGDRGGHVVEGKNVVPLEWDSVNMKFPNMPEAEKLLTKTYRDGWQVSAA